MRSLPNPLLIRAIKSLAEACDGAQQRDNVGFNGLDSAFGKSLAAQAERWTPKQEAAAYKLIARYKTQLKTVHGIDFDLIPKPADAVIGAQQATLSRPSIDTATPPTFDELMSMVKPARGYTPPPPRDENAVSNAAASIFAPPPPQPKLIHKARVGFVLTFPYDPNTVAAVKPAFRDAFFDKEGHWGWRRGWHIGESYENLTKIDLFAEAHGFTIEPAAQEAIVRLMTEAKERLSSSTAIDADITVSGLGGELMGFQKAGVAYALKTKKTYIADEPGLGKTIQALATVAAAGATRAVFVVPATLKRNWQREAMKWLPDYEAIICSGKNAQLPIMTPTYKCILIMNYEIVSSWVDAIKKFKPELIGFDEAHKLKNYKAQRTIGSKTAVVETKPDYVLMLSGTPVLNRPSELISPLDIMGRLPDFGGLHKFRNEYCYNRSTGRYDGAENLEELNQKLRAVCFIRRNKTDVLKELPAKTRSYIDVSLTNEAEYRRAERAFLKWLEENKGSEAAGRASRAERLAEITGLRKLAAQGKIDAAMEWIEDFLDSGQKLVIFAHHKEIHSALIERLASFNPAVVVGGMSDVEKDQAVQQFQNLDECRVFIGAIQAAGEGLTLTAASNVLFIEFPWTPSACDQCEDRTHRKGQRDAVTAWYLRAAETIDDDMLAIIDAKRRITDAVHDGTTEDAGEDATISEVIKRMKERATK